MVSYSKCHERGPFDALHRNTLSNPLLERMVLIVLDEDYNILYRLRDYDWNTVRDGPADQSAGAAAAIARELLKTTLIFAKMTIFRVYFLVTTGTKTHICGSLFSKHGDIIDM